MLRCRQSVVQRLIRAANSPGHGLGVAPTPLRAAPGTPLAIRSFPGESRGFARVAAGRPAMMARPSATCVPLVMNNSSNSLSSSANVAAGQRGFASMPQASGPMPGGLPRLMENHARSIKEMVKVLESRRFQPAETLELVEEVLHDMAKARRQTDLLRQSHCVDHVRLEALAARSSFESELTSGYKGARTGAGLLEYINMAELDKMTPIWVDSSIHEATKDAIEEERLNKPKVQEEFRQLNMAAAASAQKPGEARQRRSGASGRSEQAAVATPSKAGSLNLPDDDPTVQAIKDNVSNVEVERILYVALRNAYYHPEASRLSPVQQQLLRFRLAEMVVRGYGDIEDHPTTFVRYYLAFKAFYQIQNGYPFVCSPNHTRQYFVVDTRTALGRESLAALRADDELEWQLLPRPQPPTTRAERRRQMQADADGSPSSASAASQGGKPARGAQSRPDCWLLPLTPENCRRVAEYVPHEWTRYAVLSAYNLARQSVNAEDLNSMIDRQVNLANQVATFMQAKNFGSLALEARQARDPHEARQYLQELTDQLSKLGVGQMRSLAAIKRQELAREAKESPQGAQAMEEVLRWQLTRDPKRLAQIPHYTLPDGQELPEGMEEASPEFRAALASDAVVRVFNIHEFSEVRMPMQELPSVAERPVSPEERTTIQNWDLPYFQRLAREQHRARQLQGKPEEASTPIKTGHVWRLMDTVFRRCYNYQLVPLDELVRLARGEPFERLRVEDDAEMDWLRHIAAALFSPIEHNLQAPGSKSGSKASGKGGAAAGKSGQASQQGGLAVDYSRLDWITGLLSRPFFDRPEIRAQLSGGQFDYDSLPHLHTHVLVDRSTQETLRTEGSAEFFRQLYEGSRTETVAASEARPVRLAVVLADAEGRVGKILRPQAVSFQPEAADKLRKVMELQRKAQGLSAAVNNAGSGKNSGNNNSGGIRKRRMGARAKQQASGAAQQANSASRVAANEDADLGEGERQVAEHTDGLSPSVVLLSSDIFWRETGLTRAEIAGLVDQLGQVMFAVLGGLPMDHGYLDMAGRSDSIQGDLSFLNPNRVPPELQQLPGLLLRHMVSDPRVWKAVFLDAEGRPVDSPDTTGLPPLSADSIDTVLAEDKGYWAIDALQQVVRARVDLKLWSDVPPTVEDHEPHRLYFQDASVIPGDVVNRTIHRHLHELSRVTATIEDEPAAGADPNHQQQQQQTKLGDHVTRNIVCGPALPQFVFGTQPTMNLEDMVRDPCGLNTQWYARVWAGAVWQALFRADPLDPAAHGRLQAWLRQLAESYLRHVPHYTACSSKRPAVTKSLRDEVTARHLAAYELTQKALLDGKSPEFTGMDCLRV